MRTDSVFDRYTSTPFPDDRPLIPIEDIESGLDRIEQASAQRQAEILVVQTERLLVAATPLLKRGDAAGIALLSWSAQVELQTPIATTWALGWQLGGQHMLAEMKAALPDEIRQRDGFARFAVTDEQQVAIVDMLKLEPAAIANTAAEQAVLQRSIQLAGNFAGDQLSQLKTDLIAAINPDANGKVLSRKELLDRIQKNLNVGKSRAETISRTELTAAYNTGRIQTALQSSLVSHFRFLAISDARTTPICRSRNGMLIPAQNREAIGANKPPLHARCRSTLSPVLASVNPLHEEWANDPSRNFENRELAPLPKGWNTAEAPVSETRPLADAVQSDGIPDRESTPKGPHTAYIQQGKKTATPKLLKDLDEAIAFVPDELKQLRSERDLFAAEVDKLMDVDLDKAVESDAFKQFSAALKKVQEAEKVLEDKQIEIMGAIRERLYETGIAAEKAQELAAQIKITKSALKEISEEDYRSELAEFFQITGGKGGTSLKKIVKDDARAYADAGKLNIGESANAREKFETLWHELGHHVEFESEETRAALESWVKARATGPLAPLNDLKPGSHYDADELAYPDRFITTYVGKIYDDDGSTEVLSMGLQYFGNVDDMLWLYKNDPEHFLLTIGAIRK